MKVYREGKEIFEIKDYKQVGSFMNVATIEATVKTPTPFVFKVGDYVIFDYNGLTYTLYNVVPEKKQARSGTYGEAFIYELKFKADTEQLAICPFLDLVANDNGLHYTSLPSFSTYENIYGIAARLQANMDYLYPNKWRFNVVDTTDEALMELLNEPREFSISGESCFDGLKKIYDIWGVSFIHTFENGVNVITIGKSAGTTSVFRYGKGQGLRTIKKNIQNVDQLCTRAYVYGSTRNIPALWYNDKGYIGEAQYAPNLMIPPSKWIGGVPQGAYIDAIFDGEDRIEKYGLKIKTFSYDGSDSNKDEIYPSIEKVTAYDIRKAKEELGQTTLVPSASYADNERMDYILEGSNIEDDGIGSEAGYVIYSDKIFSDIQGQYKQISIGELMPEGYYKPVAVQKSMTLCSFEVTKTANYRISEIVDLVTFQKNESRSIVSASLILQKPSGEYISLGQLSFSDKIKGSLKLSENGNIEATEVGTYSIVLKFNVSWDSNAILPESVGGITLDYSIKASTVTFSRGLNILSNFFEIKIKQIGFNLNDVTASGQFKTIHIKSGMCAGRSFNITQCKYSESDDSWVLTCRRIIDNSISQRFPNNIFPIAKDDQFILLNIHMPDIYIHTAMQRLYNTALADLRHLSKPQYVIEPEIDNIQMARSPQTLKEGMYMPIEDADISYIDDTLIDSVTITNKEKELRTFQVTLRSDKIINTFSKLASRISDLESSLQEAESKANISQAQDNDDSKINEGNTGGGSSTGLDESALQQYLDTNKYITETALEGYATTDDVTELSNSVSNLRTDFDNLNNLLNDDTSGVIDTWNEVVDFLNGYKESEDLATILSKMNEDIAKRVLSTDFNSYKTTTDSRISALESLGLSIVVENGKTYLKSEHSFFTEKDIFAGGLGEEGASGGIIQQVYGVSAFGQTFDSANLTDTFNAHAINSLYKDIQTLKNSGGGGVDLTAMWNALATVDATKVIDSSHIPDLSGKYLPKSGGELNGSIASTAFIFRDITTGNRGAIIQNINDNTWRLQNYWTGGDYIIIHSGNIGSYISGGGTAASIDWANVYNKPTTLGGYGITDALPLSGGTISGSLQINPLSTSDTYSLYIDSNNAACSLIKLRSTNTNRADIGWYSGLGVYINNNISNKSIGIKDNGTPFYDSHTLIHSGNIGSYNAGSATKLQTARTIWGQSFDGSGNVSGALYFDNKHYITTDASGLFLYNDNAKTYIELYEDKSIVLNGGNVLIGTNADNGRKLQVGGQMSAIERITIFNYDTNPTQIKSFVDSGYQYTTIGGNANHLIINNDTGVVALTKSADNRQVNIHPSGSLTFRGATGGWAMGVGFNHNNGTYIGSACGGLGGNNTFQYYFYGGRYDNSAMYIHPTQNVTIGTTTDNGNKLQVYQSNTTNGDVALFESNASWNTLVLRLKGVKGWSFGCNTSEQFYFYSHINGTVAYIDKNGTYVGVGDVTAGSDARYKSKLQDIAIDVATIANAPLFSYKWNDREDNNVHLGTTAQYWMDTNFRDAVNTNNPDFYHLNYGALGVAIGVSVAKKVVNHEEEIKLLKGRVNELENELNEYRRLYHDSI